MTVVWKNNVTYETELHHVIFKRIKNARSEVELYMDYLEEMYPEKTYVEIAMIAIPELKQIEQVESLRFFSL